MKLLRVGAAGQERPALLAEDGRMLDLSGVVMDIDGDFLAGDGPERVRTAVQAGRLPEVAGASAVRVGAPISRPGKAICIGLNYSDHAEETGATPPSEPTVFMKAANTVVGPRDDVMIPRGSVKTDWEVELAVVLGATARYLDAPEDALRCVAGYAISNDVSEREFQKDRGGQWVKGKSCETFNPLGPWLVTRDEVPDPQSLGLRLSVNGRRRQDGSTKDMIFSVAHVVWYLSQFMVLEPGDLINTGTPAGVAMGQSDEPYLRVGDIVELDIDGLGSHRQTCVQA